MATLGPPNPVSVAAAIGQLKTAIRDSVSEAAKEFERQTGLCPRGIQITLTERTSYADPVIKTVVTDVKVSLGEF